MVDTIRKLKLLLVFLVLHWNVVECNENILESVQYFNKQLKIEFNLVINLNHDEHEDFNQHIGSMDLPKLIISEENSAAVTNLYKIFNMQILTFARVKIDNWNATLNLLDVLLWRRHFTPIVFEWWRADLLRDDELHLLFGECWKKGLTKTVLLYNGSIFTYTPYPTIEVRNVTKLQHILDVWHWTNLKLTDIRIPIFDIPPHCFSYRHRNGTQVISGYYYKIIQNFVEHYNGQLRVEFIDLLVPTTNKSMLHELRKKSFSFSTTQMGKVLAGDSYTESESFGIASFHLVVPTGSEIHQSFYILIPFETKLWLTLGLVFIAFAVLICLIRFRSTQRPDIVASILSALKIMIFASVVGFEHRSPRNFGLHLLFLMNGLFATNLYIGNLCSMYTSRVYEPNMRTLEDIRKTNLKIYGITTVVEFLKAIGNLPDIFWQRVTYPNASEFNDHRNKLNMSYMYFGIDDYLQLFLYQQFYLKKPFAMALPNAIFQDSYAIALSSRSPFLERFNWYLGRIKESGIFLKFKADSQWDSVMSGVINFFRDGEINRSLSMAFFQYGFVVWIMGLLTALLCFLCELRKKKNLYVSKKAKSLLL